MMNKKRLLVATSNPGKVQEFRDLLGASGADLVFPRDLGLHFDIREDGDTYLENASKKARAYAQVSGLLTLADDSGLEVDALGGAPGIHSARHVPGSDTDRVLALLRALRDVPSDRRSARFRCVVVVIAPDGQFWNTEGVCEGSIVPEPVGAGGFGYDPIFYMPVQGCTMAELPASEKNRVSHRARAIAALLPDLHAILES